MLNEFPSLKIDVPLHEYDPRRFRWVNNHSIFEWRNHLKLWLLKERNYKSDLSGKHLFTVEVHEGILTRANVPKNVWWQYFIFHPYNCFLLLPSEHRPQPPNREWCIQSAYARYGRDAVKSWYESLPFRARPFQLL